MLPFFSQCDARFILHDTRPVAEFSRGALGITLPLAGFGLALYSAEPHLASYLLLAAAALYPLILLASRRTLVFLSHDDRLTYAQYWYFFNRSRSFTHGVRQVPLRRFDRGNSNVHTRHWVTYSRSSNGNRSTHHHYAYKLIVNGAVFIPERESSAHEHVCDYVLEAMTELHRTLIADAPIEPQQLSVTGLVRAPVYRPLHRSCLLRWVHVATGATVTYLSLPLTTVSQANASVDISADGLEGWFVLFRFFGLCGFLLLTLLGTNFDADGRLVLGIINSRPCSSVVVNGTVTKPSSKRFNFSVPLFVVQCLHTIWTLTMSIFAAQWGQDDSVVSRARELLVNTDLYHQFPNGLVYAAARWPDRVNQIVWAIFYLPLFLSIAQSFVLILLLITAIGLRQSWVFAVLDFAPFTFLSIIFRYFAPPSCSRAPKVPVINDLYPVADAPSQHRSAPAPSAPAPSAPAPRVPPALPPKPWLKPRAATSTPPKSPKAAAASAPPLSDWTDNSSALDPKSEILSAPCPSLNPYVAVPLPPSLYTGDPSTYGAAQELTVIPPISYDISSAPASDIPVYNL
jgi:hypothetical protein